MIIGIFYGLIQRHSKFLPSFRSYIHVKYCSFFVNESYFHASRLFFYKIAYLDNIINSRLKILFYFDLMISVYRSKLYDMRWNGWLMIFSVIYYVTSLISTTDFISKTITMFITYSFLSLTLTYKRIWLLLFAIYISIYRFYVNDLIWHNSNLMLCINNQYTVICSCIVIVYSIHQFSLIYMLTENNSK